MNHSFSLSLAATGRTLKETFEKIKLEMTTGGGLFEGDEMSGNFSGGGVIGSYTVLGTTVNITISKKPFIVPVSLIEGKIKSYFGVR